MRSAQHRVEVNICRIRPRESWWAWSLTQLHVYVCEGHHLQSHRQSSPSLSPVSSPVSSHHHQPHGHPHANSMILSTANLPALELCLHTTSLEQHMKQGSCCGCTSCNLALSLVRIAVRFLRTHLGPVETRPWTKLVGQGDPHYRSCPNEM